MLIRSRTKHAWPHSEPNCSAFLPRSSDRFLLGLSLLQYKRKKTQHPSLYCTVYLHGLLSISGFWEFAPSPLLSPVLSFFFFFLVIPHFENTIHTNMAQHDTWQICTVSHLPGWISWPSAPFLLHTDAICESVCGDGLTQCVVSSNLSCCSSARTLCVRVGARVRQKGDSEELLSHHGDWLSSQDRIFIHMLDAMPWGGGDYLLFSFLHD